MYTFLKEHHKTAFVNTADAIQVEKTKDIKTVNLNAVEIVFLEVNPFVKLSYKNTAIQTNLIGKYNFTNMAAAITMGAFFKIPEASIKEALEKYTPTNNRSQLQKTAKNTLILDAYNANPSSMKVALENFEALEATSKVLIIGDMFELGTTSIQEHQAIVDLVATLHFKETFFVGENFYQTKTDKIQFKTYQELEDQIKKHPLENQAILIKGSRGMRLERILEFIE